MPLLKPNSPALLPLLKSPNGCGPIQYGESGYMDASGSVFQNWRDLPVLINPERSLFDLAAISASIVPRRNRLGMSLKNYLDSNRVGRQECQRFIDLVKDIAKKKQIRPKVLVVGGGSEGVGVSALFSDPDIDVISFDVYWSSAISFIADGHDIPLVNESVHGVWIQAVLEHVLDPPRVVSELYRVLCTDGCAYAEVPFMQMVHEGPYDFQRFSHSGLRWLFRSFEEIYSGSVDGPGTALRWAVRYYVLGFARSRRVAAAVYWCLLWLSWADRLVPESIRILSSSGFFFFGRKSTSEMNMKSIVSYYRGK